jgi:hypothetical protein
MRRLLGVTFPLLIVQDAGRVACFALGRPRRTAANDAVWALVQLPLVAVVMVQPDAETWHYVAAWLVPGAIAGALMLVQLRVLPSLRGACAWFGDTRKLAIALVWNYGLTVAPAYLLYALMPVVASLYELRMARSAYLSLRLLWHRLPERLTGPAPCGVPTKQCAPCPSGCLVVRRVGSSCLGLVDRAGGRHASTARHDTVRRELERHERHPPHLRRRRSPRRGRPPLDRAFAELLGVLGGAVGDDVGDERGDRRAGARQDADQEADDASLQHGPLRSGDVLNGGKQLPDLVGHLEQLLLASVLDVHQHLTDLEDADGRGDELDPAREFDLVTDEALLSGEQVRADGGQEEPDELGRRDVDASGVAAQCVATEDVDDPSTRAESRQGGSDTPERAVERDRMNPPPILLGHLVDRLPGRWEALLTRDPEPAVGCDGLEHALHRRSIGHVSGDGEGTAVRGTNLGDHRVRLLRTSSGVYRHGEPLSCEAFGDDRPEPTAGAGHQSNLWLRSSHRPRERSA